MVNDAHRLVSGRHFVTVRRLFWVTVTQLLCLIPPVLAQPAVEIESSDNQSEATVVETELIDATQIFPYPIQLLPGQPNCLILPEPNNSSQSTINRLETLQEEYARETWSAPEKWTWQQLCKGEIANLKDYFIEVQLPQIKEELKELVPADIKNNQPIDEIQQIDQLQRLLRALGIDTAKPIDKIEQLDILKALLTATNFDKDIQQSYEARELLKTKIDLTQSIDQIEQLDLLKAFLKAIDIDTNQSIKTLLNHIQDFSESPKDNAVKPLLCSALNPTNCPLWSSHQINLSTNFLRTVLLREPFHSALPETITIKFSAFPDIVDLSSIHLDKELHLENSLFLQEVRLYKANLSRSLYFDGSSFPWGGLQINNAVIEGSLFLRDVTMVGQKGDSNFENFNLKGIHIFEDFQFKQPLGTQGLSLENASIKNFIVIIDETDPQTVFRQLANLKLSLNDAQATNFQVRLLPNKSDESSNKSDEITLISKKNSLDTCHLELDGFNYKNTNSHGFELITACLRTQFEALEEDSRSLSLLQPFEQAAQAARDQGQYPLEREFLYKRKKLDLKLARTNSRLQAISLTISDGLYGFGYKRERSLFWFLGIWIIGAFFAYEQIYKRQKILLEDNLSLRKHLLQDEKIEQNQQYLDNFLGDVDFQEVCRYIDNINTVIFSESDDSRIEQVSSLEKTAQTIKTVQQKTQQSHDPTKNIIAYISFRDRQYLDQMDIQAKPANHLTSLISSESERNYVRILFSSEKADRSSGPSSRPITQNIKHFLKSLEARNSDYTKIGLVENLFPHTGQWLILGDQVHSQQFDLYNLDKDKTYTIRVSPLSQWKYFNGVHVLVERLILGHFFRKWEREHILLALMFSFDALLPIIELDNNLQSFVFEDSKNLSRLIFVIQKIMAAILASILLPIFFLTGV